MGRLRRPEGRARLEWGQEGGAVRGRLDSEKRWECGLARRYEQTPPRHRTLSSSDSKGSGSTSLFILKYPVCCKGEGRQGRCGGG